MIEAKGGRDALVTQPRVGRHQFVEVAIFEGAVMQAVVADLVGIVAQSRHGEESDAVVRLIVGRPRGDLVAEQHARADHLNIPSQHVVEPTGAQRDVVQLGTDDGHSFLPSSLHVAFASPATLPYPCGVARIPQCLAHDFSKRI